MHTCIYSHSLACLVQTLGRIAEANVKSMRSTRFNEDETTVMSTEDFVLYHRRMYITL